MQKTIRSRRMKSRNRIFPEFGMLLILCLLLEGCGLRSGPPEMTVPEMTAASGYEET